jgi:Putative DNA-binding domain
MTDLAQFQQAMSLYVLGDEQQGPSLSQWVNPEALSQRLTIHANNTALGLAAVLRDLFPVITRLVGDDFFAVMARDYIKDHPPERPSLLFWGGSFSTFISSYQPAQTLPYLSDIARLETAWLAAYHASDCPPMDPSILTELPQDRLEWAVFKLHPSLSLIASPFPIDAIWHDNQGDEQSTKTIDLSSGPAMLAVLRPLGDVVLLPLSSGAFAFLTALQLDQPLGVAWQAATKVHNDFSMVQELGLFLSQGLFTGVSIP